MVQVNSNMLKQPGANVNRNNRRYSEIRDRVKVWTHRKTSVCKSKLRTTMEKKIYREYFVTMACLGGFPMDPGQWPQFRVSRTSRTFLIYHLTRLFLLVEVTFQFLRFFHSIVTRISIFTIITQSVWVSVSITVTNVILTVNNYEEEMASLIESWFQIQEEIRNLANAACPGKGLELAKDEKLKERRYFSSLISFYAQTIGSTVIGISLHFLQLPNTPPYLYSVFGFNEAQAWLRYIFVFHEAILVTVVWIKAAFVEIFILTFVNRIVCSLRILNACTITSTQPLYILRAYRALYRLVEVFNIRFRTTLMFFQLVFFLFLVMITHTTIRHLQEYPFEANVLFLGNMVGSWVRLIWIYAPMGKVAGDSEKLLKSLERIVLPGISRRQLRSCRQIRFLNGNFHPHKTHTVLTFMTLVTTNLLTMLIVYS